MSVQLRVTYLDGQVRAWPLGDTEDPDPFYTWWIHPGEHGVSELSIKRQSKSRVIVPLALVRHLEVLIEPEETPTRVQDLPDVRPAADPDDTTFTQALAQGGGVLGNPGADRADAERSAGAAFDRALAYAQSVAHSLGDRPTGGAADASVGTDIRTGLPIPEKCLNPLAPSHLWSSGIALPDEVWSPGVGSHERCSRCGAVRERQRPAPASDL